MLFSPNAANSPEVAGVATLGVRYGQTARHRVTFYGSCGAAETIRAVRGSVPQVTSLAGQVSLTTLGLLAG